MKKLADINELLIRPIPQFVISCRSKEGKNNAMVAGFVANASHDPNMLMVGVEPSRYSHEIIKETLGANGKIKWTGLDIIHW